MTALDEMVLLPRPRRADPLPGPGCAPDAPVAQAHDPAVPAQGFRLVVDGDGVRIAARDAAGRRYAHDLLAQIRAQAGPELPAVAIEDAPDIPTRVLLLDISRDRVPTLATLQRIIELAALARYTQLQLSTEHTFAYRAHAQVWRHASPLTPAHVERIDEMCAAHGIELVANQNCFGHMERWLAHDAYRHRAECPDGWELLPGLPLPPAVLAPTADNAAFVHELLAELLAHHTSPAVHIGCDEPFELGRGASAEAVAARGLGTVYAEHVARLAGPLVAEGRPVQIWADVLRRHPEAAALLPDGVTPVTWCYEAPAPGGELDLPPAVADVLDRMGTDAAAFAGMGPNLAPLADAGIDAWVAGGTSSWRSLVGRVDNATANLADVAATARAHGCRGMVVTDWGDEGHHQPPPVSFGPIAYGGAVAWGLDANRALDLPAVLSHHVFADATGRLGAALDSLGRQWARTGQRAINASPLSSGLFPRQVNLMLGTPDPDRVRDVVERIEAAIDEVEASAPTCADADLVRAEVAQAARLARHGAWRLLGDDGPTAGTLAADMAELVDAQVATWLERSRPGGLANSLARLDPDLAARADLPDPTDVGATGP